MSYPEPRDYPESDTQPRIVLKQPLHHLFDGLQLIWLREMYNKPYEPFAIPEKSIYEAFVNVYRITDLVTSGLVGFTPDHQGFQLTSDGRYYFAKHQTYWYKLREAEAKQHQAYHEILDEWDEWHGGDFDLLDLLINS